MPTVFEQRDRTIDGCVAIDTSVADGNSSTVNEKALLIKTMKLVEPLKKIHIPNHLLESKTYAKIGKNAFIHAKPAVVQFEGFEVGEKQTKRLLLLNASSDVMRIHIIPPQTRHFYIKYTKPVRMVAGMTLECIVEFTPDEWRYYYDCIRIHCPGEENLVVPIHGYPIMSTKEFPRNYTFQSIPVGHRLEKTFPLKCMAPIDFEFNVKYIQPHPAFLVQPLTGIVPANSEAEVTVTFAPSEFQTATMKIELTISQFNSQGIICTFIGNSLPGLLKKNTMTSTQSEILDPRNVSPLERVRNNRKSAKQRQLNGHKSRSAPASAAPITLEKGGIRFPADINNPSAVAKVLMQEPGKLKVNEMMRENILTKKVSNEASRQMKEAVFDHSVRQDVYEERQNQLRWQVKIGNDPITVQCRYKILDERGATTQHYMYKLRGDPISEDEYNRQKTELTHRRTIRDVETVGPEDATFDTYSNDMWGVRHAALDKFVQAARTIIIRHRVVQRLSCLKKFISDWSKRKYSSRGADSMRKFEEEKENEETVITLPDFSADKVQRYKFPTYITPNVKDDMAPDALGNVPFINTEVVVKRDVSFFNLKVPQFYILQGYKRHSTYESASGYVPTRHIRCLRTGAEDEVIHLPSEDGGYSQALIGSIKHDSVEVDVATTQATSQQKEEAVISQRHQPVSLTPPDALFKAIEYPSLQIMNPSPGLQVFQAPMPYAEVDYDYHLCPLPRYPRSDHTTNKHAATQKIFLDREDTIRGIMSWKKFPSQGLTSLSNHPTLTNVWVPRWDDCFSSELLPEEVPPLYDQLAPDDAENVLEEDFHDVEDMEVMSLKPEMISTQFALIDPAAPSEDNKTSTDMFPYGNRMPSSSIPVGAHGPVAREKREEELEYFITKKYNRLGSKMKSKVSALNALIVDKSMVLK